MHKIRYCMELEPSFDDSCATVAEILVVALDFVRQTIARSAAPWKDFGNSDKSLTLLESCGVRPRVPEAWDNSWRLDAPANCCAVAVPDSMRSMWKCFAGEQR